MVQPSNTMSSSTNRYDIAIIGGGASGMAAAWYAQRSYMQGTGKRSAIAIFERNERFGKKLLMTGNGRCNLTNLQTTSNRFHGSNPQFVQNALTGFSPKKIIALFEELGVICTVEEGQKVFPSSLHASSVQDALRLALDESCISKHTKTMIRTCTKKDNFFLLKASDGAKFMASIVIIATGGMCAPATGSDGIGYQLLTAFSHTLIHPLPAIVQIKTDTSFVKPLSGNKIRAHASLYIDENLVREEEGEVLFTDYGLSGPPILQLSSHVSRACANTSRKKHSEIFITLDFLPQYSFEELIILFLNRRSAFSSRKLEEYLTGLFHRRLANGLLKTAINKPLSLPVEKLTDKEITTLAHTCKSLPITISGTLSFTHAQTTAGGIGTADFNPLTMESYRCKGLFACGEVLDIDGDCGGFNLHWAWASGFLAGASAVSHLLEM